jgi:ABC-type transport system involved in multi-copper enzyme maturation permease subunit
MAGVSGVSDVSGPSPGEAPGVSLLTAWWALVGLSFRRQWRSVQSLVAVGLLAMLAVFVGIQAIWGWSLVSFGKSLVNNVYIPFLLPILCLCFGTQSLGGDWEDRTLVWLLTRPVPRPLVYLAKFLATLPWVAALTVGGLFLLGLLAGPDGLRAAAEFWPAVAWATVAYLALFLLLGAWFRRSTVIGVVYSFVGETLVGNMPGLVKRASVGFYARCWLYARAKELGLDVIDGAPGIAPDKEGFFWPVDGTTATVALAAIIAACLGLGVVVFSRKEYRELT